MFSAQLQFKFTSVAQAKIAAGNISQMLKEKISTFDIHGLQVTVGKDGDLAVNVGPSGQRLEPPDPLRIQRLPVQADVSKVVDDDL